MSLGITIHSKHGLALGADSLVSSTTRALKPHELLTVFRDHDFDTMKPEDLLKKLAESMTDQTGNTHRSSKITPMYKVDGRFFGARIKAGNNAVANIQDQVLEALGDNTDDLNFISFVNVVHTAMGEVDMDESLVGSTGDFIYAGYCPKNQKYEVCRTRLTIVKTEKGMQVDCVPENTADQIVTTTGQSDLVQTLLWGSSGHVDALIDMSIQNFIIAIISALRDGNDGEDIMVCGIKEHLHKAGTYFGMDVGLGIEPEEVEKLLTGLDIYNEETDCMPITAFMTILKNFLTPALTRRICGNRSLQHLSTITLRELLRVIEYLIETTARYHEYLLNDIPSVGGDLYFATITKEEGFKFRNLDDTF